MTEKKIHKLETEDHGPYEYHWIECRDPEKFQEPDGRKYKSTTTWDKVTCKLCLKRR
jgi:hypothetical protein